MFRYFVIYVDCINVALSVVIFPDNELNVLETMFPAVGGGDFPISDRMLIKKH